MKILDVIGALAAVVAAGAALVTIRYAYLTVREAKIARFEEEAARVGHRVERVASQLAELEALVAGGSLAPARAVQTQLEITLGPLVAVDLSSADEFCRRSLSIDTQAEDLAAATEALEEARSYIRLRLQPDPVYWVGWRDRLRGRWPW